MSTRLHRLIENRSSGRQQGFTLLEIAIVMVVVALLMGMGLQTYSSSLDNAKRKTTSDRLDKIEDAITLFAIQNNYLPCPANGSLLGTNAAYGISQTIGVLGATNCAAVSGAFPAGARVVPWRTLGLDELYSRDGWGNRISYYTSGYAQYDPATGPATVQGSIHYSAGPGSRDGIERSATTFYPFGDLMVYSLAALPGLTTSQLTNSSNNTQAGCDNIGNTCAAYVLISHGAHAAGAYSGSSTPTLNATAASAGETANNDGTSGGGDAKFIQNEPTEAASGSGLFDDIVRWKSAQSIVSGCGSGACGNP